MPGAGAENSIRLADRVLHMGDLRIRIDGRVRNRMYGEHHSWKLGHGERFADLKPYEYGDPVRKIDWRFFGRSNKLVVRRYEEPAFANVVLVQDARESVQLSTGSGGRGETVAACRETLDRVAQSSGDRIRKFDLDQLTGQTINTRTDVVIMFSDPWIEGDEWRSRGTILQKSFPGADIRIVLFVRNDEIEHPPEGWVRDPARSVAAFLAPRGSDEYQRQTQLVGRHVQMIKSTLVDLGCNVSVVNIEDDFAGVMFAIDPWRFIGGR